VCTPRLIRHLRAILARSVIRRWRWRTRHTGITPLRRHGMYQCHGFGLILACLRFHPCMRALCAFLRACRAGR
jgi:hypothetical protein